MSASADSSIPSPLAAPGKVLDPTGMGPLSELEEALGGSEHQARLALEVASARLSVLTQRTRQALVAGSDPVAFSQLSAIARACAAAREILDMAETSRRHDARMQSSKFL